VPIPLSPCPICRRHVAVAAAICPFCAAPLPRADRLAWHQARRTEDHSVQRCRTLEDGRELTVVSEVRSSYRPKGCLTWEGMHSMGRHTAKREPLGSNQAMRECSQGGTCRRRLPRLRVVCAVLALSSSAKTEMSPCEPVWEDLDREAKLGLDGGVAAARNAAPIGTSAPGRTTRLGTGLDPWGRPYVRRIEEGRLEVFSAGQNGIPGDNDDITRWDCRYRNVGGDPVLMEPLPPVRAEPVGLSDVPQSHGRPSWEWLLAVLATAAAATLVVALLRKRARTTKRQ
jgi:hypothetical protein